jgi:hypothetical protein
MQLTRAHIFIYLKNPFPFSVVIHPINYTESLFQTLYLAIWCLLPNLHPQSELAFLIIQTARHRLFPLPSSIPIPSTIIPSFRFPFFSFHHLSKLFSSSVTLSPFAYSNIYSYSTSLTSLTEPIFHFQLVFTQARIELMKGDYLSQSSLANIPSPSFRHIRSLNPSVFVLIDLTQTITI